MSTSNDFQQTRNEIILDAFQLLGVYGVGRTVEPEDMKFASSMFNKMIKAWQAKGLHLWSKEEGYLFIEDNVTSYTLGDASSAAKSTLRSDAVITELSTAATASATTLVVDTTTGMIATDNIGIVLDDDSIDWTTIVSVDSSTALTITAGLTSASAVKNNIYTYTTRAVKPLRIHSMRRIQGVTTTTVSSSTVPMIKLSHQDYFDLPNKDTPGTSSHFYYNPRKTDGTVHLWPRPNDPEIYFEFTFGRPLEDVDTSTDNIDLPTEWLETATYQLCLRMAPAFGKDAKVQPLIAPMAVSMLEDLLNWDSEVVSLYLIPDEGY